MAGNAEEEEEEKEKEEEVIGMTWPGKILGQVGTEPGSAVFQADTP